MSPAAIKTQQSTVRIGRNRSPQAQMALQMGETILARNIMALLAQIDAPRILKNKRSIVRRKGMRRRRSTMGCPPLFLHLPLPPVNQDPLRRIEGFQGKNRRRENRLNKGRLLLRLDPAHR
jgi:hypothetical protein